MAIKTRIRKNDIVQVISGGDGGRRHADTPEQEKDRGKRGKVLSVDRDSGRATVEGVRMVFKHQRSSRDPNRPNLGRVEKEAPIDLSNLALVCPKCDKATRIGMRLETHQREGGKNKIRRVRTCKKCGADIPERT